jgi:endogenous inhibitor of DNA gyrase (YacG/DUF329 family)
MSSGIAPVVSCPHCGTEHAWDTRNEARPFCSERCKLIDLGKWANEEYRVEQPDIAQELAESPHQA